MDKHLAEKSEESSPEDTRGLHQPMYVSFTSVMTYKTTKSQGKALHILANGIMSIKALTAPIVPTTTPNT